MRLISCTNFNHSSAGACHYVRHPKVASNLDEFTSRHQRLTVSSDYAENKECGRRTVIHHKSTFGTSQITQKCFSPRSPSSSHARGAVVLECAVTCSLSCHCDPG